MGAIVGVCLLVAIGVAALRKKRATKQVAREISFSTPAPYAEENGNGATKPSPALGDAVGAVPVVRSISTEKM